MKTLLILLLVATLNSVFADTEISPTPNYTKLVMVAIAEDRKLTNDPALFNEMVKAEYAAMDAERLLHALNTRFDQAGSASYLLLDELKSAVAEMKKTQARLNYLRATARQANDQHH